MIEVFVFQESDLVFRKLSGRENRHHAIVVSGGNRVEFMVVAFRALHWVSEEGLADRICDVIEPKLSSLFEN